MTRLVIFILALLVTSCSSTSEHAAAVEQSTTIVAREEPEQDNSSTTGSPAPTTTVPDSESSSTTATSIAVRTGSQVLVDEGFAAIDGQRVGLIAHQASMVGDTHLADLLHAAPNVELVALFGPEHGVRGDADAGEYVENSIDPTTSVPVFSLFGPTRQPTPEMLEGIDVLIYDLQDVGARYYTYISTMGLAMQAATAADIEFIVLDRPNPLGGQVGGGVLKEENTSFVGMYPIPDVYGLTAAELAKLIIAERAVPGVESLQFRAIEMTGWDHSMVWEDTGLVWIPPSPAMTTPNAALLYPATIYFEALSLSYGRGTETPFQVIGAPWLDAEKLAADLTARALPGVGFTATTITPQMLDGMTVAPAYLGETIPAVTLEVTDSHLLRPAEVGVHLLDAVFAHARSAGIDPLSRPEWLDQLSGNDGLRRSMTDRPLSVDEILHAHLVEQFQREAGRLTSLIYD